MFTMWQEKNGKLYKQFNFKTFKEAINFMVKASSRIDNLNHHPEWKNVYNKVEVWLVTHDQDSITDKDKQLSKELDNIYQQFSGDEKNAEELNGKHGYIKLFTDGGSRGNPGPSAIGYVLLDKDDNEVTKNSKYIGITTNNQAEYQGLKEGLEVCVSNNVHEIDVYMDSLLVVNQLNGVYKVKNRDLWPVYESVKELAKHFKKIKYWHVPREMNRIADSMVNECLDSR